MLQTTFLAKMDGGSQQLTAILPISNVPESNTSLSKFALYLCSLICQFADNPFLSP